MKCTRDSTTVLPNSETLGYKENSAIYSPLRQLSCEVTCQTSERHGIDSLNDNTVLVSSKLHVHMAFQHARLTASISMNIFIIYIHNLVAESSIPSLWLRSLSSFDSGLE